MVSLFKQFSGHETIQKSLKNIIEKDIVPRTLLFAGPEGVGKKRLAILFAQALLNSSMPTDLHVLSPSGKSGTHSMDSIRECIKKAKERPFQGKYAVFIIDHAEKLSVYSANALLKLLEEGVEQTRFILITSQKEKILPTILSRSVFVHFKRPTSKVNQKPSLNTSEVTLLEALCQGAFASFEQLQYCSDILSQRLQSELSEKKKKCLEKTAHLKDMTALEKQDLEQQVEGEAALFMQEEVKKLIYLVIDFVRDLHIVSTGGDESLLRFKEKKKELSEVLEKNGLFPLENLLELSDEAFLLQERSTSFSRFFTPFLLKYPGVAS